ncbi:MAG TPA: hypothetical protein VHQ87_08100, partial [Rhizobacter sp.]|nr:hypothetical protein [Rhizobacter sp.]
MTVRFPLAALTLISGLMCSLMSGPGLQAADDRDLIVRKNGTKITGYIESETTVGVAYRTIKPTGDAPKGNPSSAKLNEVASIIYFGMDTGSWAKGQSERDAGNYEAAAEFFNQLATTGSREWEKVYGSMAEGECWELARKYSEAAKAFAVVVNSYGGDPMKKVPAHRLWLDAKYRLGMAYAQGKNADADKIAGELEDMGKKEGLSAAEARANAIRAAKFAAEGNFAKFSEFMKKATLRSFDEPEVWFHFKLFSAESLRQAFKKGKESTGIYREILNGLGDNPARQAQISLGLGLTLMENDKEGALVELLKLDVLPYGSPDQKCEARYNAGRLLWESAQATKSNADAMKDPRKA